MTKAFSIIIIIHIHHAMKCTSILHFQTSKNKSFSIAPFVIRKSINIYKNYLPIG